MKYSTGKVVKLGKKISSAICCKLFTERNALVFSNDECSILKASLVGFVNARSLPHGYLHPV